MTVSNKRPVNHKLKGVVSQIGRHCSKLKTLDLSLNTVKDNKWCVFKTKNVYQSSFQELLNCKDIISLNLSMSKAITLDLNVISGFRKLLYLNLSWCFINTLLPLQNLLGTASIVTSFLQADLQTLCLTSTQNIDIDSQHFLMVLEKCRKITTLVHPFPILTNILVSCNDWLHWSTRNEGNIRTKRASSLSSGWLLNITRGSALVEFLYFSPSFGKFVDNKFECHQDLDELRSDCDIPSVISQLPRLKMLRLGFEEEEEARVLHALIAQHPLHFPLLTTLEINCNTPEEPSSSPFFGVFECCEGKTKHTDKENLKW